MGVVEGRLGGFLIVLTIMGLAFPVFFNALVQGYNRPPPRKDVYVPSDDPGSDSPQQVL